ncbi:MAG: PIN domain-containing protein [Pseudomonadota bacterium]
MRFLVDANVLSEATRPRPDPNALAWLERHERRMVVDPIILGEIRYGILRLPRGRRRRRLEEWFDQGVGMIDCVDWDAATGLRWSLLLADLREAGAAMPIKDSLIAATALQHGFAIATRNVADFRRSGATVVDPFEP